MTIERNLGGDRLGSGNKMNLRLHNYERSTHDLSKIWRSSMACGTLVPFLTEITLPGDTFDINLNTMVRTLPTLAPLFGSFKVQLDVFTVPIRLYNAQLHMNKLGVGLKMSEVKLPRMGIACKGTDAVGADQFDQSCLLAYLGVRGAPFIYSNGVPNNNSKFNKNALFLLAYWDIYKNYYANKQEENGYMISNSLFADYEYTECFTYQGGTPTQRYFQPNGTFDNPFSMVVNDKMQFNFTGEPNFSDLKFHVYDVVLGKDIIIYASDHFNITKVSNTQVDLTKIHNMDDWNFVRFQPVKSATEENKVVLQKFPLSNIDDTLLEILQKDTATPYELNENSLSPYVDCIGTIFPEIKLKNYYSQNGLGIKTYQSDVFNNWLNTEWIDGADGINSITAIDTSDGSFTIDTLNLSKKVYDMLNRVAVSGGSYNDWQEAIWGEESYRMAESPIYCGGLSTELVFEEVVSTANTETTQAGDMPLGSLAGRGTQSNKRKGGNIYIKTKEPSMIIGIASITPRIDYSQGNKWFTRLETMDDFHKPALDGIGFQELITESMAHWDAAFDTANKIWTYKSAGKQPAWIDYMTSFNETYGHFAHSTGENALMHLTLNRQYEYSENKTIKDLTTYIDPTKYNYAFATTDLTAQNFWVQIACDITARRKMSAKIIPNL